MALIDISKIAKRGVGDIAGASSYYTSISHIISISKDEEYFKEWGRTHILATLNDMLNIIGNENRLKDDLEQIIDESDVLAGVDVSALAEIVRRNLGLYMLTYAQFDIEENRIMNACINSVKAYKSEYDYDLDFSSFLNAICEPITTQSLKMGLLGRLKRELSECYNEKYSPSFGHRYTRDMVIGYSQDASSYGVYDLSPIEGNGDTLGDICPHLFDILLWFGYVLRYVYKNRDRLIDIREDVDAMLKDIQDEFISHPNTNRIDRIIRDTKKLVSNLFLNSDDEILAVFDKYENEFIKATEDNVPVVFPSDKVYRNGQLSSNQTVYITNDGEPVIYNGLSDKTELEVILSKEFDVWRSMLTELIPNNSGGYTIEVEAKSGRLYRFDNLVMSYPSKSYSTFDLVETQTDHFPSDAPKEIQQSGVAKVRMRVGYK